MASDSAGDPACEAGLIAVVAQIQEPARIERARSACDMAESVALNGVDLAVSVLPEAFHEHPPGKYTKGPDGHKGRKERVSPAPQVAQIGS